MKIVHSSIRLTISKYFYVLYTSEDQYYQEGVGEGTVSFQRTIMHKQAGF